MHRSVAPFTTALTLNWCKTSRIRSRGVKYLNFQATYTLSRFNNAGSVDSNSAVSGGDQDF